MDRKKRYCQKLVERGVDYDGIRKLTMADDWWVREICFECKCIYEYDERGRPKSKYKRSKK